MLTNRRGAEPDNCGTRHPHYRLRALLAELLAFAEPQGYEHTACAVTKNLVGSPHVDQFDTTHQLVAAVGEYEGGELCVDEGPRRLAGVETRNRVARVDGRRVHWVRAHRGGDRYSVVFYGTAVSPGMEVEGSVGA